MQQARVPKGSTRPDTRPARRAHIGWAVLNLLQTVAMAVWSVFWITAAFVALALTLRRDMPLVMARRLWAPGMLWIAGARLVVDGAAIDWSKPHIFVMNHQSALDIPSAFVALKTNLRFIAKKELAWVPFLGWYMVATGMIFVDRGRRASGIESMQRAGRRIRAGASIIAYPEGTRSRDGYVQQFKKGVFAVALEAGVPIVPVAVQGSRDVLPSNRFSMRPGTVHVHIGEPVDTLPFRDGGRDALIERVRTSIVEANLKLGGLGPAPHR